MLKKIDKKSFLYLSVVIIAAILVCVGSFYYLSQIPEETMYPVLQSEKKEEIIDKQLQELEQLKGETQLLTEEEIQKQLEELNKLRQ